MTEEAKPAGRHSWEGLLTRWKDPTTGAVAILTLLITFGGGVLTGAALLVDPKVEALRSELTRASETTNTELTALRNEIRANSDRTDAGARTVNATIGEMRSQISRNGERIARVETELTGTSDRVNRLQTQVTKNSEEIVEVKVRGTPD